MALSSSLSCSSYLSIPVSWHYKHKQTIHKQTSVLDSDFWGKHDVSETRKFEKYLESSNWNWEWQERKKKRVGEQNNHLLMISKWITQNKRIFFLLTFPIHQDSDIALTHNIFTQNYVWKRYFLSGIMTMSYHRDKKSIIFLLTFCYTKLATWPYCVQLYKIHNSSVVRDYKYL